MKKLVYLSLFANITAFGQTVTSYVSTIGLVGWWPFNGNASDKSGNGYTYTMNGSPSQAIDHFNFPNKEYTFNGISCILHH